MSSSAPADGLASGGGDVGGERADGGGGVAARGARGRVDPDVPSVSVDRARHQTAAHAVAAPGSARSRRRDSTSARSADGTSRAPRQARRARTTPGSGGGPVATGSARRCSVAPASASGAARRRPPRRRRPWTSSSRSRECDAGRGARARARTAEVARPWPRAVHRDAGRRVGVHAVPSARRSQRGCRPSTGASAGVGERDGAGAQRVAHARGTRRAGRALGGSCADRSRSGIVPVPEPGLADADGSAIACRMTARARARSVWRDPGRASRARRPREQRRHEPQPCSRAHAQAGVGGAAERTPSCAAASLSSPPQPAARAAAAALAATRRAHVAAWRSGTAP